MHITFVRTFDSDLNKEENAEDRTLLLVSVQQQCCIRDIQFWVFEWYIGEYLFVLGHSGLCKVNQSRNLTSYYISNQCYVCIFNI